MLKDCQTTPAGRGAGSGAQPPSNLPAASAQTRPSRLDPKLPHPRPARPTHPVATPHAHSLQPMLQLAACASRPAQAGSQACGPGLPGCPSRPRGFCSVWLSWASGCGAALRPCGCWGPAKMLREPGRSHARSARAPATAWAWVSVTSWQLCECLGSGGELLIHDG